MPALNGHCPPRLRAILDATRTPFAVKRFEGRAAIFHQGDACDSIMQIQTGLVRLAVTTPGGREAVCGVLRAGAFLGEEVLAGQAIRRQTAIAMTAVEVLTIERNHAIRLLHTEPAITDELLEYLLERHARLEADLCDQLLNSSERRLAHTLLVLAGSDGQHPCDTLPRMSQEVIAEMVGTTRSRVNGLLGKFRKLGFIERDGHVLRVRPSLQRAFYRGSGRERRAS